MTMRVLVLALSLMAGMAAAAPPELAGRVPAEGPSGCAEYRFLFLRLYRAELWTQAEVPPGREFGLSLTYRRDIDRDELVESSISEMARMSGRPEASFGRARAELERAMRSVSAGDRYTAWRTGSGEVRFYLNGGPVGSLTHDADLFLDIWLGPSSRRSEERDALLSGRCDD